MADSIEDRRRADRRRRHGVPHSDLRTGGDRRAGIERRLNWDRRGPAERRTPSGAPPSTSRRTASERRAEDRRIGGRQSVLQDLQEAGMLDLLDHFTRQAFAAGAIAVSAGGVDRSLYLVESGIFDVLVPSEGGSLSAALLRRGDMFGELAFFDGEPRSAEIRAAEDSVALVLTVEGFDRLRATDTERALALVMQIGSVVSRRFRIHNQRLASLSMVGTNKIW